MPEEKTPRERWLADVPRRVDRVIGALRWLRHSANIKRYESTEEERRLVLAAVREEFEQLEAGYFPPEKPKELGFHWSEE